MIPLEHIHVLRCDGAMALQTQGADVLKVALAATLGHGQNVVRVPKRLTIDPLQAPAFQKFQPVYAPRPLQVDVSGASVGLAQGANAAIPEQNLLA